MITNTDTTSNHTRAQPVSSTTRTRSMLDGRRDDSMRRRRRVLATIDHAAAAGDRLSAAAIARAALLTELRGGSPHVNGVVVVSGATVCARDRRE
jgi:hypothetical protein